MEAADVLKPPGRRVPEVAGLTYLLMSYPDSTLKREIMVKRAPTLTPPTLNPQYSLLSPSPRYPVIGVPVTGSPAPTPSLYSQMQKSKTVNVRSIAACSPSLSRVMGPLMLNVHFKSGKVLLLNRW